MAVLAAVCAAALVWSAIQPADYATWFFELFLGAAYVLEGSIRRAGNRLRITAQLVETLTRHSAWAERYDREMADVFAIQDEIARSIAQALRVTLSPQEEKTIARKPTENLQAYDHYLRGRSYTRRENLDFALQMYEQAIQLDELIKWIRAQAKVDNNASTVASPVDDKAR